MRSLLRSQDRRCGATFLQGMAEIPCRWGPIATRQQTRRSRPIVDRWTRLCPGVTARD